MPIKAKKLKSYMSALDTLGRTKAQYAEFLAPLVESCLPDDILRIWERKRSSSVTEETTAEKNLTDLMDFLNLEVKSEQRFQLVKSGFGSTKLETKAKVESKEPKTSRPAATATALVSTEGPPTKATKPRTNMCGFCDKPHNGADCLYAAKLTLEDKKELLKQKKMCTICLKPGHIPRTCRAFVKCILCFQRHYPIMCPGKPVTSDESSASSSKPTTQREKNGPVESNTLTNAVTQEVILQSLLVNVLCGDVVRVCRALLDSGSQNSYISSKVVGEVNMHPVREYEVIHNLFGGVKTLPQKHNVHMLYLESLDNSYRCNFEVLEQGVICGQIPRLTEFNVQLLKEKGVILTEVEGGPDEVDLLIGADVMGKLIT